MVSRRLLLALLLSIPLALTSCVRSKGPASTQPAAAAVRMPAIFSDHMVLQRNVPIPVWGWTEPGQAVTVTLKKEKATAVAGKDGKWMAKLPAMKAGGPYTLTVNGKAFNDVMVGEVWLCSGQSNMEWPVSRSDTFGPATQQSPNPKLRLFTVKKARSSTPLEDCEGTWTRPTPESIAAFSAVGYFFGRDLQDAIDVPVGLIHSSWGGSPIEVWLSREVLGDPRFKVALDEWPKRLEAFEKARAEHPKRVADAKAAGKPAPQAPRMPWEPACLYNAMIAPLKPYAMGGAIWYQGEANAGNAALYRQQLPAMIDLWRKDFASPLPFMIVSLANYLQRKDAPTDSAWAELREAQAFTAASVPKTGLALAIDIGEAADIHPKNKQEVGRRLSLAAQAIAYGKKLAYSGPVYESMKVEGSAIRVKFGHAGKGLVAKGGKLTGFAVAGADKAWAWADARIEGDSVVVSSPQVARPVAVRYAWADNPECNLYNAAGLPAVPFRTDEWPRP